MSHDTFRVKAALEAKVSPLGHAARRRRAGKPVVVFTLGGEYDIDWPLNTTSAKRGRSSSSWLQKGIQSGILQKVEIQNHDESLSAACKLFPTPTFSVEGRRELETRQKLRLSHSAAMIDVRSSKSRWLWGRGRL